MNSLIGTKTSENLMKAFAGESQARNRYTYYASVAKKEDYIQIANIFTETAENEKEHAKRFYECFIDEMNGEIVNIQAIFPVALWDTKFNLLAAAEGEKEEWHELYPSFADVAEEEGFPNIACIFREIGEVERHHEARFRKLYTNLVSGEVFKKDKIVEWKCNNCGYVHKGKSAPSTCPACECSQGYFEVFIETY